jgi:uncharacterized protein (UPF0333 family)
MRKKFQLLILALILAATITFFAVPSEQVEARPANSRLFTYYSDATYQTVVGWKYIGCYQTSSDGQQTEWYEVETMPC